MATSRTRGHPFKLYKGLSTRSSFFSERLINRWNRLPEQARKWGGGGSGAHFETPTGQKGPDFDVHFYATGAE